MVLLDFNLKTELMGPQLIFRNLAKFPFHCLLIILFFLSHGYSENIGLVPVIDMFIFFVVAIAVTTALVFLMKIKIKSINKAGLFVTLLLCAYLFFGAIQDGLKSWYFLSFLSRYRILIPVLILIGFFGYLFLKKSNRPSFRLTAFLNVLLLVFVLVDLIKILSFTCFKNKPEEVNIQSCVNCYKPDIYLIVMDEYAGNNTLKNYYNYDNQKFKSFLSRNGFHILRQPTSNYSITPISMESMFNMKYVDWVHDRQSVNASDYAVVVSKKISQSRSIRFLHSIGYKFSNCSIFDILDQPAAVDYPTFSAKMRLITNKTFCSRIEQDLFWMVQTKLGPHIRWVNKWIQFQNEKVNNTLLSKTYESIDQPSNAPKFVYTHLMMPHLPYIFDSLGRSAYQSISDSSYTAKYGPDPLYLQYLVYTNSVVSKLIFKIITASKAEAVIIVMSDHGNRDKIINSPFNNFNAIYFPSKKYDLFYDSMSNVNQFRVIFNSLFHQKLPLLKDSVAF